MEAAAFAAQSEAIVFLSYFEDFPDPRQRGKVVYPLNEILLLCLLAVLAGAETFVDIARRRSRCCAGSCRSGMERRRTTISATFSQSSTPRNFSAASSPGLPN
jgi:hypothetical protein